MPEAVAVLAPAWNRAEPAGPQDPVQPRSVGPATPATAVPVQETRSVAGDGWAGTFLCWTVPLHVGQHQCSLAERSQRTACVATLLRRLS